VSAVERVIALTRLIPDYPSPGVLYQDLTPVLADGPAFAATVAALIAPFAGTFDVVAGVEARGFSLAGAAATHAGAGLVLIRKAGKLPGATHGADYELEYGTDRLEVQADLLPAGTRVLVVDDVLATGGTLAAAAGLVETAGWLVAGLAVVLEISDLHGRDRLAGYQLHAVVER
jgi:adenine phosphoribosyltransferase